MHHLLPLLLFNIAAAFTPGPNNLMIMSSGLNFGIKKSFPLWFGIVLGFPIMTLIGAVGFGTLFIKYHWIQWLLQILGVAYMLFLAYKLATATTPHSGKQTLKPISFFHAFLLQWVNPKGWMMIIGAISIFVVAANDYLHEALIVTGMFLLVGIPSTSVWLLFGASLRNLLQNDRYRKIFNVGMAILLVLSIALMFIE